jgi:hypothetical protein
MYPILMLKHGQPIYTRRQSPCGGQTVRPRGRGLGSVCLHFRKQLTEGDKESHEEGAPDPHTAGTALKP